MCIIVLYTKMVKGWHKIIFVTAIISLSGCAGTRLSKSEKIDKVISTARSYIGTPYKFGGMSRSGLDCSGLLILSFKSIGISLPRTSIEQSKIGKRVHLEELKPGDLVFFSEKKGKRKVSHAGMVTNKRGDSVIKFIHASTSRGVIEVNLLDDYYRKIFVKARRLRL
jgi:probable lipoprotein NlpC